MQVAAALAALVLSSKKITAGSTTGSPLLIPMKPQTLRSLAMREFEQPKLTPATEMEIYDVLASRLALKIHEWFEEEAQEVFNFGDEVDSLTIVLNCEESHEVQHVLWSKTKKKFANILLNED